MGVLRHSYFFYRFVDYITGIWYYLQGFFCVFYNKVGRNGWDSAAFGIVGNVYNFPSYGAVVLVYKCGQKKVEQPILSSERVKEMFNMAKNQKSYTLEFKQQIVDLYNAGGTSYPQLEREYGVNRSTISGWVKQLSPIKVSEEETVTLREYKALQKENQRLKTENEILKKATAIFAKEQ